MEECTLETALEKAGIWQAQSKSWHFHLLTPDCMFNSRHNQYALVLENSTDAETNVVYSDEPHLEADLTLRTMLHGDLTLDQGRNLPEVQNKTLGSILQRARSLTEQEILWHHHMLFPECVFNQHQGQWNIVFEDKETGELLQALYEEEPVSDLAQIEHLFFEQGSIKGQS